MNPIRIAFIIVAIILGVWMLYSFLTRSKPKPKELGRFELLKGKFLVIATPHSVERVLLFLYAIFFLWWDVLQNKVLDLGIDYHVTWWKNMPFLGTFTSSALDTGIIILILFHITLVSLFIMSLDSKSTHRVFDRIVGTIALFGVAIVLTGFVNSLYSETIRFLFIDMESTTFYHLGVGIEFLAGFYWAWTR